MKKRLLSILTALAMCLSLLPVTALAASDPGTLVFDIAEGSIIIEKGTEAGTIKVTYGDGQVKDGLSPSEPIVITGSFAKAEGVEAAHQIDVSTSANIIARDLTIDNSGFDGCYAMAVSEEATNVTLALEGKNTFTAGRSSSCLVVTNDSTLNIWGGGSVTAQGGDGYGSAGISVHSGNTRVSGGTVNAIGGESEIDGMIACAIAVNYGSIAVSGGTVNATGGTVKDVPGGSAGILVREADFSISGGTVNATGKDVESNDSNSAGVRIENGSLTISGGEINAFGGKVTGDNCKSRGIYVPYNDLTISNAKVNATADLVTGRNARSCGIYVGGNTVINGSTVNAIAGAAAGQDGQSYGIYADRGITLSDGADVTARAADRPLAEDAGDAATEVFCESYGIYYTSGDVTINNSKLEAASGNNTTWSMGISGRGAGEIIVNGSTLNVAGGHAKYTASRGCAASYGISVGDLIVNGGTVTISSGDAYGYSPESIAVAVKQVAVNNGTLNAKGGAAEAKWGGATSGAVSAWGDIKNSSGAITAKGGNATFAPETVHDLSDCASSFGIRSGHNIEISGGTAEATGGAAETESYGIKVQYNYYPDYGEPDGGCITISGGEVNATGGAADSSLGICARVYHYDMSNLLAVEPGTIAITGGRMTARTLAAESAAARMALNVAPSLPDAYWWRTTETAAFTAPTTPYSFSYNHSYVQFITGTSFVDVTANDYYFDAVLWAVENGITKGTSATTFGPDRSCTRAQAVTFLWRAAGCPAPQSSEMPFRDVAKGSYYEPAVLWAVENGITNGSSASTFSPNKTCTRGQIVTFLWRAAGCPAAESSESSFTDVPKGSYYEEAVLWAVESGITKGTSDTTFRPDRFCTRAQIVTFLYRAMNGQ